MNIHRLKAQNQTEIKLYMKKILDLFNTYLFGPALPIFIFVCGFILTIKYGSFIFLKPKKIVDVLTTKGEKKGISPFKTAMLALASTLGVGNIVGVATAIYAGGPGAVFWLTLSAFVAMSLKYGEVVLAMKYRTENGGEYRGGAMYYMRDCLKNKRLSVLFAILCIVNALTVGNIVQINAVSESFSTVFSVKPIYLGIVLAVVVFLSVYKGTKQVSDITSKVIPVITAVYIILSLYIILINYNRLYEIAVLIFENAFSLKSAVGGIGGYVIVRAVRYGVARGIMSNEAGSGTSPIAHAKSNLESPVEQGFWGIFEVFADTVIMCNLTAFVVLFSYNEYVMEKGLDGMSLVIASYSKYAGKYAGVLIAISVLLFAYATVICQGFYGSECVYFLSEKPRYRNTFILVYCVLIIYGAIASSELIWSITDFNVSLMTVINTTCIMLCSGEIKKETKNYFTLINNKYCRKKN